MSAHAVYRIFSEAGTPLYVGMTSRQWWVRVAEQASNHPQIANTAGRVEVTHHATRLAAAEVECAEIKRLRPRINTRSNWHESRDFTGGELKDLVLAAVRDIGSATSAMVAEHLPHVEPSSIRTTMMRLRQSGEVRVVEVARGTNGRPMYVVAATERTAA